MPWIMAGGAILGGLLGSRGSRQAGTTTTTNVTDLPEWQKPLVSGLINYTKQNWQGQGTPLLQPAQDEYLKTIQGGYLSPEANPWLKATYGQAAKDVTDAYTSAVQPRTDAMFNGPGSLAGNSAYAEMVARNQYGLGQNLQNLATNIYGGNYQQERGRQFGAASTAPGFTSQQYGAAYSPFSSYLDVVGRPFGTSGAQSQPYYTNPAAGALGGGLLGYQLGGMMQQNQPNNYNWLSQGSSTPYAGSYGWGNV